ncbi:MAG: penicillin-binding protein 2 [Caulobacteraceae bacterium]|nr:penicillin-binding protein 2 [Caulobacteraceae bacterium]
MTAVGAGPIVEGAEARDLASRLWRGFTRRLEWPERAFERARASGRAEDDTRLRIFFVMALFAAGFLTLAGWATRAALFSGLDAAEAASGAAPKARADLVDRNGEVLAMDLTHYGLYLHPREISDVAGTRAALARMLPGFNPRRFEAAMSGRSREYYLAGGLDPELKTAIHDLALPGVDFEEEGGRAYPLGPTGAHVIGFAGRDGVGLAGAERAFDKPVRDNAGREAIPLSVDLRVQGALQDELETAAAHFQVKDAVGMVVNVRTGEILAMASYPSFDAAAPGRADPAALVNHVAATVYEPGSVFKVFTLAMGLDTGLVDVNTVFDVHTPLVLPGQTIHDYDKGDRTLPLWEVFTHSSNIGAARMALRVGADNMAHYFRAFGLFAPAPSELVESARPLVQKRLSENIVATYGFGHAISVSPLAIATGMTSILNGGVYRPLTLKKLAPGQAPAAGVRVIKASTSRTMLNLMRLNATNGTGRGADAKAPGYRVGGKTGSATKLVNGRYSKGKLNLASFAAIFPTDGPFDQDRYYVLIMMDEPKPMPETGGFTTGGAVSAPIAGKVIARIAPFLGVRRVAAASDVPAQGRNKDDVDSSALTGHD